MTHSSSIAFILSLFLMGGTALAQNPPFVSLLGGGSYANPDLVFSNTPGAIRVTTSNLGNCYWPLFGGLPPQTTPWCKHVWLVFGNSMPGIPVGGPPSCGVLHSPLDYMVGPFPSLWTSLPTISPLIINYAPGFAGYTINAQVLAIDYQVVCTCWCQHGMMVCSSSYTLFGGPWPGSCGVLPGVHIGLSHGYQIVLP